jgi:hypothetical protein
MILLYSVPDTHHRELVVNYVGRSSVITCSIYILLILTKQELYDTEF